MGVVERSHYTLKRCSKLNAFGKSTTWYNDVDLAISIHITSYHSPIGCSPGSFSNCRESATPIDSGFRSHAFVSRKFFERIDFYNKNLRSLFLLWKISFTTQSNYFFLFISPLDIKVFDFILCLLRFY